MVKGCEIVLEDWLEVVKQRAEDMSKFGKANPETEWRIRFPKFAALGVHGGWGGLQAIFFAASRGVSAIIFSPPPA